MSMNEVMDAVMDGEMTVVRAVVQATRDEHTEERGHDMSERQRRVHHKAHRLLHLPPGFTMFILFCFSSSPTRVSRTYTTSNNATREIPLMLLCFLIMIITTLLMAQRGLMAGFDLACCEWSEGGHVVLLQRVNHHATC